MVGRRVIVVVVALVLAFGPTRAAPAAEGVPPGWTEVAREVLAPGAEHVVLRRSGPDQEVHVARLAPGSPLRLVPVLAGDRLGTLERTTSMCARVACVAAVNGDFWGSDQRPIGAAVSGGELVTTPAIEHIHLTVGGDGRATFRHGFDWSAAVSTLSGYRLAVAAVNRPLGDGVNLYSRRWGPTTGTPAGTAEVTVELLLPSPSALPTGGTTVRVVSAGSGGNSPIGPNQVVVAGRGAAATAVGALVSGAVLGLATLHVDVGGVQGAMGVSPLLLSGGRLDFPADNPDSFTQDRHARTVVGATATGDVLLVTVDDNGTSAGMSLRDTAALMTALGAVHAMNLDGGGSTTFVSGGTVRNSPPGGERPVVSALALTPTTTGPLDGLLGPLLGPRN